MYFLKLRLQPHLMYTGLRMYRPDLQDGFHNFLISAKKSTYAGSDDETSLPNPLLDQSMQLEFREGDWLYRDIYYGMSFFSGIEVIYFSGKPLWSMTYSGGTPLGTDSQETRRVYKFLRAAHTGALVEFAEKMEQKRAARGGERQVCGYFHSSA